MNNKTIKYIKKIINILQLDLTGKVVLTEVGSENYLLIPIIAALADAKKVYAWTKDSKFGLGFYNKINCLEIANSCNVRDKIEISLNQEPDSNIQEADIITNSNFLRPLDESFLKKTKSGVVIPLMFESWELRDSDIDVGYCKNNNIKVAGTWENYPDIKVFNSVGNLCVKLAMESGFEIYQNNIIVWSSDEFGDQAVSAFKALGANSVIKITDINVLYKNFEQADFIFICDYEEKRDYFSIFDFKKLKELNDSFGVVHLIGDIDNKKLNDMNIKVYPDKKGYPLKMSKTLDYLGIQPFINLQVAGFKVSQNMIENKESDLNQPITY